MRSREAFTALATTSLLLATLSGAGCRQLAGIEDPDPPALAADAGEGGAAETGSPAACGISFTSATCATCMAGLCCAEAARCAASPSCAAFGTCISACAAGDVTCASTCRTHVAGSDTAVAGALASCKASRCTLACDVRCGGYVYGEATCGTCGVANADCCADGAACMSNPECVLLDVCEHACKVGDSACLERCELEHPRGVDASRAFGACLASMCNTTCVPPVWACLQHPSPPPTTTTSTGVVITYTLIDYQTFKPVEGLTVRLCLATDLHCTSPVSVAPVTTNVLGQAMVHAQSNTFDGFAEIQGAGYTTLLVFLPTLVKSTFAPTIPIPMQTTFTAIATNLATPNEALGNVIASTRDCAGTTSGGVSLTLDAPGKSTRAYFIRGTPSPGGNVTDDDGFAAAAFLNVTPETTISILGIVAASSLTLPARAVRARPGTSTISVALLYAAPP